MCAIFTTLASIFSPRSNNILGAQKNVAEFCNTEVPPTSFRLQVTLRVVFILFVGHSLGQTEGLVLVTFSIAVTKYLARNKKGLL